MPPRAAERLPKVPTPFLTQRGVALDDLDHLHRDLELVGDQLGVGRLMALPVRGRAGQERHAPVGGHDDLRTSSSSKPQIST